MTGQEVLDRLSACATVQDVVDLAGEAGFEITEDRARALLDQRAELADAALAGVSGGFHALGDRVRRPNPLRSTRSRPSFSLETPSPASANRSIRCRPVGFLPVT